MRRRLDNAWEDFYNTRQLLQESQSGWKSRNTAEMRWIRVGEERKTEKEDRS
jgi:hypothetical protein